MPTVINGPRLKSGQKALPKKKLAFDRSNACNDILHYITAYFQLTQNEALASRCGAVCKLVFLISNEIAAQHGPGAGKGHSNVGRDLHIGGAAIDNEI